MTEISSNPHITADRSLFSAPPASKREPVAAVRVDRNGYLYDDGKGPANPGMSTGTKVGIGVVVIAAVMGGLAALRGKVDTFKSIDLTKNPADGFSNKLKFYTAKAGQAIIDGYKKIPFLNKKTN